MDDAELSPQQSGKLQRFLLPLIVIGCVTIVLALFAVGYLALTTPETPPEDITTVIGKVTAEPNEKTTSDDAIEEVKAAMRRLTTVRLQLEAQKAQPLTSITSQVHIVIKCQLVLIV